MVNLEEKCGQIKKKKNLDASQQCSTGQTFHDILWCVAHSAQQDTSLRCVCVSVWGCGACWTASNVLENNMAALDW